VSGFGRAGLVGFDAGFGEERPLQFDAWRSLQRATPTEAGGSGQQLGIARAAGSRGGQSWIL